MAIPENNETAPALLSRSGNSDFLIVGLGASAGGFEALQSFFERVLAGSGIAYVVILHLSPDHDSELTRLLQQVAAIPVIQVADKTKVEPDQVYVVSPDKHLVMVDGWIDALPNLHVEERRAPVDIFFRTLADSHGPRAVCVILSGTGANGSMGLKRIKEHGGAAIVQNPREATFSEMPRNAISTQMVDEVLNAADIPAAILLYRDRLATVRIHAAPTDRNEADQQALREIFTQLRVRTGHDFSSYKRPTILRRIERRISIHGLQDLPSYAIYIYNHPEELTSLLKDLLISVTNFFRDQHAFEALEKEVVPVLFKEKTGEVNLRIWVAGCATGEEAYSIAMLCAEQAVNLPEAPRIQIFATDIDDVALAKAREGIYTINDAADVSPERLRRFFTKEGEHYRISQEIREMILFAPHNFLKDPPFSRIDLVSCRNVLIYLTTPAQERIMEIFHFALRPGRYLFLGTAESADGSSDLFSVANREQHIYQARHIKDRSLPMPESSPYYAATQHKELPPEEAGLKTYKEERITFGELHQRMLEQYAPPSLVVNEEYEIVHLTEQATRYLQLGGGELSRNLLSLVRQELRLELRSALYQAAQQRLPVEVRGVKLSGGEQPETVNIQVRPVFEAEDAARGFMLVIFEPAAAANGSSRTGQEPAAGQSAAQNLEDELIRLKLQVRASNEQHEFQSEELKATNEELQAMNEELRSAAEELETSKEELQSINEELSTLNQELKIKIEETGIISNNLQNLINSTNIGTIFLDRALRVALFTPPARSIFNLIPSDRGRPLSDITSHLEHSTIAEDANIVLDRLITIEREVTTANGMTYLMRLLPYRTEEDRINGVVVTFIDITERKKAEELIRESEDRLSQFVRASSDAIYIMSPDWKHMHSLKGMNFLEDTDMPSRNWLLRYIPIPDRERVQAAIQEAIEGKKPFELEHQVIRADGSIGWTASRAVPFFDEQGAIKEWFGTASDITSRLEAESDRDRFFGLSRDMLAIASTATHRWVRVNAAMTEILGWSEQELLSMPSTDILRHGEGPKLLEAGGTLGIGQPLVHFEHQTLCRDGSYKWIEWQTTAFPSQQLVYCFGRDVTERREQERKQIFLLALNDKLRLLPDPAEIMRAACAMMESFTGVPLVLYSEVSYNAEIQLRYDVLATPPTFGSTTLTVAEINRLAALYHRPVELLINDIAKWQLPHGERHLMEELGIGAMLTVPLYKNGRWAANMGLYSAGRQSWSNTDIALLEETADRVWTAVDRAKAEIALRVTEERYRTALKSADMGAWDWDIVNDESRWNDQHYLMLGMKPEEGTVDSNFFLRFVHPDDLEAVRQELTAAVERTGVYDMQAFRIIRADNGQVAWMSGYGRTVARAKGKATRMVGVMYDITRQVESTQALRDRQLRLDIAQRAARVGIWGFDLVKNQGIASPEWNELTGYPYPGETFDLDVFLELVHPADRARVAAAQAVAVKEHGAIELEYRLEHPQRGLLWLLKRGQYVPPLEGMNAMLMGSLIDITERKLLEQQKDEFIGIASHELRTPVTSIKAYAEILREMFEESNDQRSADLMQKLDVQVDRLTKLIYDLLDTTRISEGKLQLEKTSFQPDELIADTAETMQRVAGGHRIELRLEAPAAIHADRERIRQVLINLMSNALKYSPDAERILVQSSLEEKEGLLKICVQDFGIGISEEGQRRVFERFFQDQHAGNFSGLGLGLFISAGIIRQHGGAIRVKSKPGEGALFCFTLPLLTD